MQIFKIFQAHKSKTFFVLVITEKHSYTYYLGVVVDLVNIRQGIFLVKTRINANISSSVKILMAHLVKITHALRTRGLHLQSH
jgi:hypothetical protein